MNNFDYDCFDGSNGYIFAVNSDSYNESESVEIFENYYSNLGYKVGFSKGEFSVRFRYVEHNGLSYLCYVFDKLQDDC